MRKFAEVRDGIVTSIHQGPDNWSCEFSTESGLQSVEVFDDEVSIGDLYVDYQFKKPEYSEIVPDPQEAFTHDYLVFENIRKGLFEETRWARERHQDNIDNNINDSIQWKAWLTYWQSLRDLPNQENFDPLNVTWPKPPVDTEIEQAHTLWQRLKVLVS